MTYISCRALWNYGLIVLTRHRGGLSLALIASISALAGCGQVPAPSPEVQKPAAAAATEDAPDLRFRRSAAVAQSTVIGAVGGESGDLWTWVGSSMDEGPRLIRHARDDKQPDVIIPLAKYDAGGPSPAGNAGFAVDEATDSAWLAAGMALFRLDLTDHELTSFTVPAPPRSKVKDSSSPSNAGSGQEVGALRIQPSGSVLLLVTSASALVRFTPSTEKFDLLPLPDIGDPADIAVATNGDIAVGMLNYESHHPDTVLLVQSTGVKVVNGVESLMTIATPDGFVVSGLGVYKVSFAGATSKVPIGGTIANGRLRGQALADGRVVIPTADGQLQVLDPSGRRDTISLGLGRLPCGLGEGSHTPGGAGAGGSIVPTMCPANPQAITVARDDLYVHIGGPGLVLHAPQGSF